MSPFRLGLTGSIGMGKSTTAQIFVEQGIPVWDADATVHRLYAAGGAAAELISQAFPDVIGLDGAVSRSRLKELIRKDGTVLDCVTALVHPLVAADRASFVATADADLVLLDIPLLFETGAEEQCDAVLLVTAPATMQRARVLARGTLTEADFHLILARQMPDAEKRARAAHIVETLSLESVRAYVQALIFYIRQGRPHA